MLPHDPSGQDGIARDLPDAIKVHDPDKADVDFNQPQGMPAMVEPAYMSTAPQTDIRNLENDSPPQQQMDDGNDDEDNNNDMQQNDGMMQEQMINNDEDNNNDMQQNDGMMQ